jgi:inorganic phosphate transporter, PiT family
MIGAFIGSQRIFRKLGEGVFDLKPIEGFSAQGGAAAVVLFSSLKGGPVSSSQVLSSAIVGAGSATRGRAVHWSTAGSILASWFTTIPGAAILTAGIMIVIQAAMRQ